MLWRGLRDASGFWKIIVIRARSGRSTGSGAWRDVLAVKSDAAAGGLEQAHHGAAEGRFAGTRLTYDSHRLAAPDPKSTPCRIWISGLRRNGALRARSGSAKRSVDMQQVLASSRKVRRYGHTISPGRS